MLELMRQTVNGGHPDPYGVSKGDTMVHEKVDEKVDERVDENI